MRKSTKLMNTLFDRMFSRTRHSALQGLDADDHTQYHTAEEHAQPGMHPLSVIPASLKRKILNLVLGDGEAIAAGLHGGVQLDADCVLTAVRLVSMDGVEGSITVNVWKGTYASPPSSESSIGTWSITSGTQSETTGLEIDLSAGDYLYFNVDSVEDLTRVLVSLDMTVTESS